jgi:membrane-bound lytic murein transglycosylase MltF
MSMIFKVLKLLLLTALLVSLGTELHAGNGVPGVDSRKWTNKYDPYFRKYTKRFFGVGLDWKWFKAQAIAESNLRQDAKSWVNAKGIMQVTPSTFHEIKKKNPSFVDINEPRWNIAAGIYYDSRLFRKWKAERPHSDKMNFTFASYNAGFSTIVRAQKVCEKRGLNENLWHNIEKIAPVVRGWRHAETLGYVEKINTMMK